MGTQKPGKYRILRKMDDLLGFIKTLVGKSLWEKGVVCSGEGV